MIGQTLGHYRILELLGKGGMGEVYLAEDTKLQRRVALKVLTSALAEDLDRRQRFEREARAAAAFNHPNIVTIHSVEEIGGVPFLTLELIDGQTLAAAIPPTGMPLDRLLALAIPLADAIGAAHQRGITHRDLKPANVMVTTDGRIKVLDFGLAKLKEDARAEAQALMPTHELTGEGRILGTAAYMSPEQAEGKAVDQRTDVFALGVLLYEMATGVRPFKGDTQMSLLSAIIKDTPAPLSEVKRDVPRELSRIVQRCLAKDPEDRYQTAKDLRNDLRALKEDFASGELASGIRAQAPVAAPAPAASLTKSPVMIGVAALVLVALVAVAVVFMRTPAASVAPVDARAFDSVALTRLTTTGTAGMAAISADGRYAAYVVTEDRKQSLWLRQVTTSSNVQVVPPGDVRFDGISFSPDSNYIYYVAYGAGTNEAALQQVPVLGGGARTILNNIDTAPSFSPDAKRFAFIRGYPDEGRSVLLVADADGRNERELASRKNPIAFRDTAVAWSPDGKVIAVSGSNRELLKDQVVLVDVDTGKEATLGTHDWRFLTYLAWVSGGRSLLVNGVEGGGESSSQVWAIAYPGGEVSRVTNDLSTYTGLSVSADGHAFVTVRNELRARIWSVPGGNVAQAREVTVGAGADDGVAGMAWTPDGRVVYAATTTGNSDIWIMNADGSNRVQLTNTPADDLLPLVTSDGRTIVFLSERDGPRTLWRMNIDGSMPAQLTKGAVAYRPTLSADGQWVYYSDPKRNNFRLAIGGGTPEPLLAELTAGGRPLPPGFHEPTPSPDGRAIAGHYSDPEQRGERMVVLSVEAGAAERRFPKVPANARWAPDGKSLLYTAAANLWRQPLGGGEPTRITAFTGDEIFSFAVSPDQKQWALVRGDVSSDVVLVSSRSPR
jgi:Tol biopolymer transport system component/tRNA A-37 threonylcarbamoyl transferase component Bud32